MAPNSPILTPQKKKKNLVVRRNVSTRSEQSVGFATCHQLEPIGRTLKTLKTLKTPQTSVAIDPSLPLCIHLALIMHQLICTLPSIGCWADWKFRKKKNLKFLNLAPNFRRRWFQVPTLDLCNSYHQLSVPIIPLNDSNQDNR